ncbi:MAG: regulatory protein GemA [Gammaproteobacteria bacterium]|nr:regulatory protein GemA [Gammaproteobacteria bacterium]
MSRQANLAKIHIAKKELHMGDDAYRAMLNDVAGVNSASKLDFHQQTAVIQRLKQLGFKVKASKKLGATARQNSKSQGDKIRALWLKLADLCIVRDRTEPALMAYVKRMTKGKYHAPQFCDPTTASRIIETLKKWIKREQLKIQKEDK